MRYQNRHPVERTINRTIRAAGILLLCSLSIYLLPPAVQANTPQAQFHLGRIWMNPEYDGAEGWVSAVQYPAGISRPYSSVVGSFDQNSQYLKRTWVSHVKKFGTYLFSTDWTDPAGKAWSYASSYAFRSYNYNYPPEYTADTTCGIMNYVYPVSMQEYLRWERPEVVVATTSMETGLPETVNINFYPGDVGPIVFPDNGGGYGTRPAPIIDPTQVTEEVIDVTLRYIQGVELKRSMYGYPYGTPHQDYVLQDITLTNDGVSGRTATAPVLTGQSLNNVIWAQAFDFVNHEASGAMGAYDTEAEYMQPWGTASHAAVLLWDGDHPDEEGPDWGDPSVDMEMGGHLTGNAYVMVGPLFVSAGPGVNKTVDDPAQPAFRMLYYERGIDMRNRDFYPTTPQEQRERLYVDSLQIPLNTSFRNVPALDELVADNKPISAILGYGTRSGTAAADGWDLGWEESVRIVQMVAAGGIDQEEGRRIGLSWIEAQRNNAAPSTWMSPADIALVQTGRDTAMKAAAMAYWNFYKTFPPNVTQADLASWGVADMVQTKPATYLEFDVPDGPRPPGGLYVRGLPSEGIEVRWTREAESSLDHDTGVNDFAGYRIWRQTDSRSAPWELIGELDPATFPFDQDSSYLQVAADGIWPAGLAMVDTSILLNSEYWYAVTAIDDGTQNWARSGKALESTRWWTWTGYWIKGVKADSTVIAGYVMDRVAPNPPVPGKAIWLDGNVWVSWNTEDTDVKDYVVYRNDTQVSSTNGLTPLATISDTLYLDREPLGGTAYYYIQAVDRHGNVGDPVAITYSDPTSIDDIPLPKEFALYQNAPNPFNPVTRINFDLPEACHVRLAVYNTSGQLVRVLSDGARSAGRFDVAWNGRNDNGQALASGVYIYRLSTGSRVFTKRMTLIR